MNKLITIENNTIFEKYYCSKKVLTGWDIAKIHSFEIKKVMDKLMIIRTITINPNPTATTWNSLSDIIDFIFFIFYLP